MNDELDDSLDITATAGRDSGKVFRIQEVNPIEMSGFMLRLLAALRASNVEALLGFVAPSADDDTDPALGNILRMLMGCDPDAVHALVKDALQYVKVNRDAKHPNAFFAVNVSDIKELATLGQVLGAFGRLNILPRE